MSDIGNLLNFKSFFFPGQDPNVPQDLRQKLALALLMQKRKAPSNFGEGLSAIGDAIGDRSMMRQIEGDAAGAELAGQAAYQQFTGGGAPQQPQPSTLATPPPVQAAAVAAGSNPSLYTPGQAPTDQTPVPGDVQEGSPQQGTLLRPNIRSTMMQPGAAAPAPQAAPTRSMVQESVPPDAPIRTNPDGTIAGNLSSPQVLPPSGRPTVANFGQKPILAPTSPPADAPVMAEGGDDPRRAIALAMLKQGQSGQPQQSAFAPAERGAPPPPSLDRGIVAAPPAAPPIAKAPPPQQVAQAAPPPGADPGYVTPARPERPPPRLTTDRMQELQNFIRNTPASKRETVARQLQPLFEQETAKVSQAHEMWKAELTQDRALAMEREKQLADQRARQDAAAAADLARQETRQKIRKGEEPTLREDVEGKHIYNPATGEYEPARIAGADPDKKPPFKGTEFQGKALVNYGRAKLGQDGLQEKPEGSKQTYDEILADSPLQSALSTFTLPVVGKIGAAARSDAYKEADTHAENYVQAFIRQQSGGAYTDAELEKEARAMLPKYGDTTKQLQAKREQREQFLSGLYGVVGTSGQKGLEIDARQREAARAAKGTGKADPLEGREILMPDKTIKVRRNGQWVPK